MEGVEVLHSLVCDDIASVLGALRLVVKREIETFVAALDTSGPIARQGDSAP